MFSSPIMPLLNESSRANEQNQDISLISPAGIAINLSESSNLPEMDFSTVTNIEQDSENSAFVDKTPLVEYQEKDFSCQTDDLSLLHCVNQFQCSLHISQGNVMY